MSPKVEALAGTFQGFAPTALQAPLFLHFLMSSLILARRRTCGKIMLNSTKGNRMDTRFYRSPGLDIERIARDLEGLYVSQDYQVQHFGNKGHMVVQLKMGSQLEAVIGMQAALTLTLQRFPRGVVATVGQQQWIDKAAAGAIGMLLLWPLAVTAGVGAIRQASLEGQLFSMLDTVVLQQRADVQIGSVPPDIEAQARQQAPPSPYESPASGRESHHEESPK